MITFQCGDKRKWERVNRQFPWNNLEDIRDRESNKVDYID